MRGATQHSTQLVPSARYLVFISDSYYCDHRAQKTKFITDLAAEASPTRTPLQATPVPRHREVIHDLDLFP